MLSGYPTWGPTPALEWMGLPQALSVIPKPCADVSDNQGRLTWQEPKVFFSFFSICPELFAKWNRTALYFCRLAKISLIFFTEKRCPNSIMMVAWHLSTGDSLGRCTLLYSNHTLSPWREFPTDATRVQGHNCVHALSKCSMSGVVVSISIAFPSFLRVLPGSL